MLLGFRGFDSYCLMRSTEVGGVGPSASSRPFVSCFVWPFICFSIFFSSSVIIPRESWCPGGEDMYNTFELTHALYTFDFDFLVAHPLNLCSIGACWVVRWFLALLCVCVCVCVCVCLSSTSYLPVGHQRSRFLLLFLLWWSGVPRVISQLFRWGFGLNKELAGALLSVGE